MTEMRAYTIRDVRAKLDEIAKIQGEHCPVFIGGFTHDGFATDYDIRSIRLASRFVEKSSSETYVLIEPMP